MAIEATWGRWWRWLSVHNHTWAHVPHTAVRVVVRRLNARACDVAAQRTRGRCAHDGGTETIIFHEIGFCARSAFCSTHALFCPNRHTPFIPRTRVMAIFLPAVLHSLCACLSSCWDWHVSLYADLLVFLKIRVHTTTSRFSCKNVSCMTHTAKLCWPLRNSQRLQPSPYEHAFPRAGAVSQWFFETQLTPLLIITTQDTTVTN